MANRYEQQEEEIRRLKAQIQVATDRRFCKHFMKRFRGGLMLLLAQTPYRDWPQMAKSAFEFWERELPIPAGLYKDLLPK